MRHYQTNHTVASLILNVWVVIWLHPIHNPVTNPDAYYCYWLLLQRWIVMRKHEWNNPFRPRLALVPLPLVTGHRMWDQEKIKLKTALTIDVARARQFQLNSLIFRSVWELHSSYWTIFPSILRPVHLHNNCMQLKIPDQESTGLIHGSCCLVKHALIVFIT